MNETNPIDPADTAAKPKAPTESATAPGVLNATKQKLASLAEKAKEHDFKGDAHKAAEGVKNLKDELKKHDFKTEFREAFAEAKQNPKSLWKKPETLRPGKDLAIVGLAASIALLLLLLVTSNFFFGFVCLVLGLGALLFSALGLKTEGRKLAVGGSVVGVLVVLFALGQTFGSSAASEGDRTAASSGGKTAKTSYDPKLYPPMTPTEGVSTGKAKAILDKADANAKKDNSLNVFGFHTGMSLADAKTLREHYGLAEGQLDFEYNLANGEVFEIKFTPKAMNAITKQPNNFATVESYLLDYFGILEWNNEREIGKGEIDSIFQSNEEKMIKGDAADVSRCYRTADGVVTILRPTGWSSKDAYVFRVVDTDRRDKAEPVNRSFANNQKCHAEYQKLAKAGVKTKMLVLKDGMELLLKEQPGTNVWVSALPVTKAFYDAFYKKATNLFGRSNSAETALEDDKYDRLSFLDKLNTKTNGADGFGFRLADENTAEMRLLAEPFDQWQKNKPLTGRELYRAERQKELDKINREREILRLRQAGYTEQEIKARIGRK